MKILGIKLDKLKYTDFFANITRLEKRKIIFTPNPEILLEARKDKHFKKDLEKADYLLPDATGLYLATQILELRSTAARIILLPIFICNLFFRRLGLYKKYGEKISGSDLTKDLVYFAEEKGIKIAILDPYRSYDIPKCKAQATFRQNLQNKFPELDFEYIIYKEKKEVINQVNTSGAKILFSTLGMKTQERSIIEIMEKCPNITLGLGVGSSFDYLTGFQKRAPKILRTLGLEWFYRIFTSPQKIKALKRIYNATFVFISTVIKEK